MNNETRRLRAVYVSAEQVWSILHTWQNDEHVTLPRFVGIPEDAEIVSVYHDYQRHAFGFIFSHDSFDPAPVGCQIPSVDDQTIQRVVQLPKSDLGYFRETMRRMGVVCREDFEGNGTICISVLQESGISIPYSFDKDGKFQKIYE